MNPGDTIRMRTDWLRYKNKHRRRSLTGRRDSIYIAIGTERKRQDRKYSWSGYSPSRRLAVLTEELGEVARAVQRGDENNLREELTQLAAAAVRWLEARALLGEMESEGR